MIELGINNCFAVKRWPEPEAWARVVREELGLEVVQFSLDLLDPRAGEAARAEMTAGIAAAMGAHNLRLHSTFSGLVGYSSNMLLHPQLGMRLDALDWYEQAIELSGALGAEATGGHIGALSVEDYQSPARKQYLLDFLLEALCHLSRLARRAGLKCLLWEPMPLLREAPATIREALDLHNRANRGAAVPIQFCLDLGHQCTAGTKGQDRDPYEWLRQVGHLSPCIHLQQTDGKGDYHWPFTEAFNKYGIIQPGRVLEALDKAGARNAVLVFEVIHSFESEEPTVISDLKESVAFWRSAM